MHFRRIDDGSANKSNGLVKDPVPLETGKQAAGQQPPVQIKSEFFLRGKGVNTDVTTSMGKDGKTPTMEIRDNVVHDARNHINAKSFEIRDETGKYTILAEHLTFNHIMSDFGPETRIDIKGLRTVDGTGYDVVGYGEGIYALKMNGEQNKRHVPEYAFINMHDVEISRKELGNGFAFGENETRFKVEAFGDYYEMREWLLKRYVDKVSKARNSFRELRELLNDYAHSIKLLDEFESRAFE